jgi:hypothetical protein
MIAAISQENFNSLYASNLINTMNMVLEFYLLLHVIRKQTQGKMQVRISMWWRKALDRSEWQKILLEAKILHES